jgi:8-oxo-dGTP pyrophosphatase MutT (NUDIX family)
MNDLRTVVIGVVVYKEQVLIGRKVDTVEGEEDKFLHGKWHFPGGKKEENETDEEGTVREVREESGIEVKILNPIGERKEAERGIHLKWFLCEPVHLSATPIKGSDLEEVRFAPISEVAALCDPSVVAQWPEKLKRFLGVDLNKFPIQ